MDKFIKYFCIVYLLVAFFFMGVVMATEYPTWGWYHIGGYVAVFFAGAAAVLLPLVGILPVYELKKKAEEDMK